MKKLLEVKGAVHCILKPSLRMKLTVFLTIISIFNIQANSYSQNKKLSLDFENGKVSTILYEIEAKSDFKFLLNREQIDLDRKVTLKVDKVAIKEILNRLFQGTGIDFEVLKKQIILRRISSETVALSTLDKSKTIQQFLVSGTISDTNGFPLSGANVVEKGTSNGVTAGFDGEFTINVAEGNSVLTISYIGYATKEIAINGQDNLNIVLEESASGLEEVVVIGFGQKRKKDLTGSVSVVNSAEIEKTAFASPQFALQGNTTGVRVINTSGDPNSPPEIYVRGIGSWQGNAQPLYVVDGQIITPPTSGNLDEIG